MAEDYGIRSRVRSQLREARLPDQDLEKAIFNNAIRRCKFSAVACCWANVAFCECYKSAALAVIRNRDAVAAALAEGSAAPDVVTKGPRELRPDLWEDLVRKKTERDSAYGIKPSSNTNMYRCRKCNSRECHYFGLQTRSGDEPMTIFVTCLNCGNRWRTEG